MQNLIHTAVVTLFAASAAQAQQAVQWSVTDGGNGHWYQWLQRVPGRDWSGWRAYAEGIGGHLATVTTSAENWFVTGPLVFQGSQASINGGSAFIGAFQPSGSGEPDGDWQWVTGEPFVLDPSQWRSLEDCCGGSYCNNDGEDAAALWSWAGDLEDPLAERKWNDVGKCLDWWGAVIEWSADCNSDGIVDYGQCRDGTLPDYNGNNIPDCCESGTPCVVGNYPVQWRVEDGGNGHWYQWRGWGIEPTFDGATAQAMQLGGHLATVVSDTEAAAVLSIVSDDSCEPQYGGAIWLGARQQPGQTSPGSGWSWVTAEPWSYERWRSGEPNDFQGVQEDRLVFSKIGGHWLDVPDHPVFSPPCVFGLLVEWDADCNNDGLVDYGQILQGQLGDTNADGIPDICQQPTCVDADIYRDFNVNGADLGILLSQWGPNTPLTESDLNNDGVVNGADLGIMLSFWGACP